MNATDESIALARDAAHAAVDKLAQDIIAIDVSERLAITDIFLIASASNERQVNGIVDGIEEQLLKQGLKPVRREGRSEGRWVLLDYAEIVVHVQHEEDRVFYALERLWGDCPNVDLQLPETAASAQTGDGASSDRGRAQGSGGDAGSGPVR